MDVGKSVSRVGGKAQLPAYRAVAGDLRLFYSQFEELEVFSRFGSRLDEQTRTTLARGRAIREALKQPQFDPLPASVQVATLVAATAGLFDNLSSGTGGAMHRRKSATLLAEKLAAGGCSPSKRASKLERSRPRSAGQTGRGSDRMQTAESLRRTIAVTEELQSVVKTMKALAGVNIRQYERAAHAIAEYNRHRRNGPADRAAAVSSSRLLASAAGARRASWARSCSDPTRACAAN